MRVAIVGKDARQRAVGEAFAKRGITVISCDDFPKEAEITVLPMPVSEDGKTLFGTKTSLADCFAFLAGKTAYGGRCSAAVMELALAQKVRLFDHFAREEETVANVVPTVEGALQIAMQNTPFTLHGAEVLVVGYGRIGRLLAHHLKALGAKVSVASRKEEHLAWCDAFGYHGLLLSELPHIVGRTQVIFNTAPTLIFDETLLKITSNALIIDLASAPGGVDFAAAEQQGKNVIHALALPVKVAPQTAGEIICKTILTMYEEENTRVR